jgi:hypothetical protein
MRPVLLLASIPVAVCIAAPAVAAVDDQCAPATPAVAPAPASAGFVAAARKAIDDTLEKQRAVVSVLRQNVVSRVMAGSWRLSLATPAMPRATALVSRPVPNDFADGALSSTTDADALDQPLGARWRVLHGDASSHVPMAAWMPDLQSADARYAALRPTMNLSGEWALPNDFTLGVMPGMAVDYSTQGRRQSTGTFAVTLGKSWSPQWRTFVDMARDRVASVQPAGASTTLDAGVTFVATPSTKIDFAVTHGLSDSSAPIQAGLGLSSSF